MSDTNSTAVYLRLSVDLHRWVVDEALMGRRSMNAVVVEAIDLMRAARTERQAQDRHIATVDLVVSRAQLPDATAFLFKSSAQDRETEVFVLEAGQAEYSFLAHVKGEEVISIGNRRAGTDD